MIQPHTSIIILGTHLDESDNIMVSDDYIDDAKDFVKSLITDRIGMVLDSDKIHSVKVSNITGEGIIDLKDAINISFLTAFNLLRFVSEKKDDSI